MENYDIVIVGGGLVGASLAVALRDLPLRIALIDAKTFKPNDKRFFALHDLSCQFLKDLGLWSDLVAFAAPINEVHVSQQGYFGNVRLKAQDIHLEQLGFCIPAQHIESALLKNLIGIDFFNPATCVAIDHDHESEVVTIAKADGHEQQIKASLVIGADGSFSSLRQQLQIECEEYDYQQAAIVTKSYLKRDHQGIAYQRFGAHGTIAMLPLAEKECATIWTLNHQLAEQLMALSATEFTARLQQEFNYRLGRIHSVAERISYPLRMIKAKTAVANKVIFVGNALHTFTPITAQGFNLALFEVAMLAEKIKENAHQKGVLTEDELKSIAADFFQQQNLTIQVTNTFARFFTSESAIMHNLLQIGMIGLDNIPLVKKSFIHSMMGRMHRTPRLFLRINGL
jgi:2-octaprenyl-6-methoxyphenol hydroxylase